MNSKLAKHSDFKMDATQRRIIKLANVVVLLVTLIRMMGALVDADYDNKFIDAHMTEDQAKVDLALAAVGSFIFLVYLIITLIW